MHHYGEIPSKGMLIDHINGDRTDNRISNLRLVTRQQNVYNTPPRGEASAHKGVGWNKHVGKWQANIKHEGKVRYLGVFDSEEEAAMRYLKEAELLQGEHAYHNSGGRNRA
jgi:hypothetical protein